jgi:hypothetical protein
MRFQYLLSQVIRIGSRHLAPRKFPELRYTNTEIALKQ